MKRKILICLSLCAVLLMSCSTGNSDGSNKSTDDKTTISESENSSTDESTEISGIRQFAYAKLKELPEWADAVDC